MAVRSALEEARSALAQERTAGAESIRALQQALSSAESVSGSTAARAEEKDTLVENLQEQLLRAEREIDVQRASFERDIERVSAQAAVEMAQAQLQLQRVDESERAMRTLSEKLHSLEADYEVLQRSFEHVSAERQELVAAVRELEEQLLAARAATAALQQSTSDADFGASAQMRALEQKAALEQRELRERCSRLLGELSESNDRAAALNAARDALQDEHVRLVAAMCSEKAALATRLAAERVQHDADAQRVALDALLLKTEKECSDLRQAKAAASEELAFLQQRVAESEAAAERSRAEVRAMHAERDTLAASAQAKDRVVDEAASALAQNRRERHKLFEALGVPAATAGNEDVIQLVHKLHARVAHLSHELERKEEALDAAVVSAAAASGLGSARISEVEASQALAMNAESLAHVQAELAEARTRYNGLLVDVGRAVEDRAVDDASLDPRELIAKMRHVVTARDDLTKQLQEEQERVRQLEQQCKRHMEALDRLRRNDWSAANVISAIRKRET
jgi:chromosome segregation ATPase